MTKLSKAQRARLEKLAAYLEGLPKRYRHFDMAAYLKATDPSAARAYAKANGGVSSCGTVACAVGHGPAAGILMPPRFLAQMKSGDSWETNAAWNRYSSLFIGMDPNTGYANADLFEWLFSGGWKHTDNHHYGAAARIRYLLVNGMPDADWCFNPATKRLYAPYRIDAPKPAVVA